MNHHGHAFGMPRKAPAGLRRQLASMLYETLLILGVLGITFMMPLMVG